MAKILVVDDDPAGQRLIKYMLTPDGHEVITASNGIMGLQAATKQSPDLVILDVMLPGLDGFEVCRRLRSSAATKQLPIIMLSGKTQASDRDTGLKMGANEYMVKPVDRQELLDTVKTLMQESAISDTRKARILAFIGARGGAGTSTVTTNVSVLLGKMNHRTILVDMNPSYSALGDMIGLNIEQSVASLFRDASGTVDTQELKGLIKYHSSGLNLLWAETYPDESEYYNHDDVKNLFSELGGLADFIVVDVPASPGDNAIALLSLADEIFLVTSAGKEAITERVKTAISRMNRFGIKSDTIKIIVVDKTGGDNLEQISQISSIEGLPIAGLIHECKDECGEAETSGDPVVVIAPSSQIAQDIEKLASYIISG
ncbi:MAG: response regulator [Dehalococcoidales bacterium]|nr:response regulator [Dehalococcoidales bacterium]